jgi:flagellar motor switch/type III secretory pathway protein FliN
LKKLQHEREQVNAQAAELIGRKIRRKRKSPGATKVAFAAQPVDGIAKSARRLEVELAQKNMSVQNLREKMQQKYHLNLDDIRSECITITLRRRRPAKVRR